MKRRTCALSAAMACSVLLNTCTNSGSPRVMQAVQVLDDLRPGLAVVLGSTGDISPAALHDDMGYVVHVFDTDDGAVARLRSSFVRTGINGQVTASRARMGAVPVADNTVNLMVVQNLPSRMAGGLTFDDIFRATAPYGTMLLNAAAEHVQSMVAGHGLTSHPLVKGSDDWQVVVKPYPEDMDEWRQFRHDPALSSLSQDLTIGPAEGVRWIDGPLWSGGARRTSMILSSEGRAFYLLNPWRYEGKVAGEMRHYRVEARDAFNGYPLWSTVVSDATEGQRPMATDGRHLYVHLGDSSVVTALDAATGDVVRKYMPGDDIFLHNGSLVINTSPGVWDAYDPASGTKHTSFVTEVLDPLEEKLRGFGSSFNHVRILMEGDDVYLIAGTDGRNVVEKRNFATGTVAWATPREEGETFHSVQRDLLFTLTPGGGPNEPGDLKAYDVDKGTLLWAQPIVTKKGNAGVYMSVMYRGDRIWTYDNVPQAADGHYARNEAEAGANPRDPSKKRTGIGYIALNPRTGEFMHNDIGLWKEFGRCGPDLATPNYILAMDMQLYGPTDNDSVMSKIACNFVRGDCGFSYAPANGLMYNSDNNCRCAPFVQGTVASGTNNTTDIAPRWQADTDRLEKGPAYGQAVSDATAGEKDWPLYRATAERNSLSRTSSVSAALTEGWRTRLPGKVSAPVVAGNQVFVAEPDAHAVHALDRTTGAKRWTYTAGGRVDSPPTYYRGLLLFGSSDGYVQAVRADNSTLVWRFRAAPIDQRIMVRGQLESLWPVFGTVLVYNDVVYALAGRHGDADGGMFFYALDPLTGDVQWSRNLSGFGDIRHDMRENDINKARNSGFGAYQTRNDLMMAHGSYLMVGALGIDLDKKRETVTVPFPSLIAGQGTFICDNTVPNPGVPGRYGWYYVDTTDGVAWRAARSGGVSGCLLTMCNDTVFGIRHSQYLHRWKDYNDRRVGMVFATIGTGRIPKDTPEDQKPPFWTASHPLLWQSELPENNPRMKAIAVGKDNLVVATQPGAGLVDASPDNGELLVYSRSGDIQGRHDLGTAPLYDGIALAHDQVYVSTEGGEVVCLN